MAFDKFKGTHFWISHYALVTEIWGLQIWLLGHPVICREWIRKQTCQICWKWLIAIVCDGARMFKKGTCPSHHYARTNVTASLPVPTSEFPGGPRSSEYTVHTVYGLENL